MFNLENGRFVVKLGKTNDLRDRMNHISSYFGVEPRIIDVFPVEKNHEFEQFLHNHPKFIHHKYKEQINGKISSETYIVENENHYQKLKKTIEKEKYQFVHRSVDELKFLADIKKNELEMKKLDLISKLIDIYGNNQDKIEKILNNNISIAIINNDSQDNELITTQFLTNEMQEEIISTTNNDDHDENQEISSETLITDRPEITISKNKIQGKMVQIYNPNDLTKVFRLFDCIGDALREITGTNHTSIKYSARNKVIYCGYRWYFVDRDDPNPSAAKNIGQSIDIQERSTGFVARLNMDKTIVLNVYKNQTEACEKIGLQKSLMSNAIKFISPLSGNFWALWDLLDKEMQEEYLKNNQLPVSQSSPKGTSVQKIDPNTNEILEEFSSLEKVRINLGITTKTIKKYSISQTKYKGYLWKVL